MSVAEPIAFASIVETIDPLLIPTSLRCQEPHDLSRLYGFDLVWINSDRTKANPNCGQANGTLFAYDFGSSIVMPSTPIARFERYFFAPSIVDRSQSHLCREFLPYPEIVKDAIDNVFDSLAPLRESGLDFPDYVLKDFWSHVELIEAYIGFCGENRSMIEHEIMKLSIP